MLPKNTSNFAAVITITMLRSYIFIDLIVTLKQAVYKTKYFLNAGNFCNIYI